MANKIATVSSANQEKKKEEKQRSWFDLPPELLSLILSHLFARDYCTFHFMPSVDYGDPYLRTACQMDIPELSDAEIRFSKYGWLLMCQGDYTVFFFNPFTKVRIGLPDIPFHFGFHTMCFSSPPTSSDCLVIGISSSDYRWVDLATLKRGEEIWRVHRFENNQWFRISNSSPILHNGLYYCLGDAGNLGIFDPKDNKCSWTVRGKRLERFSNSQQSFMMKSDGDLFAVFVACDGGQVSVLRLERSKKAWHEVQSLGDKMLYVCNRTSLSEMAVVKGTGNKIYFPKFNGNNGVFYSLATRKFHSFVGNYSRGDFYGTKDMNHCTWIKPMLTAVCDAKISW